MLMDGEVTTVALYHRLAHLYLNLYSIHAIENLVLICHSFFSFATVVTKQLINYIYSNTGLLEF